ncbi:MAG TPA: hypothetical protein VMB24_05680 [Dehalococcoidales bacterium]|nr:hypothetical protein [Dehalococcoidales bacterium]
MSETATLNQSAADINAVLDRELNTPELKKIGLEHLIHLDVPAQKTSRTFWPPSRPDALSSSITWGTITSSSHSPWG